MSYPLTPTDDIITPIIAQLSNVLTTQIGSGIGRTYIEAPDGPPEHQSVIFPMVKFDIKDDTNGKLYIKLYFNIRYILRRSKLPDDIAQCYLMFSSFIRVLSSWPNQGLTYNSAGNSITVTPTGGQITQFAIAATPFISLQVNTEVLTEINVLTV